MQQEKYLSLHRALLGLHKSLLEFVRGQFESVYGKIATPHDYLSIVMTHDAFAWLRTLSESIVSLDEAAEGREGAKGEEELRTFLRELLSPDEAGRGFARKYAQALQESSEVAHAHGIVMEALKQLE